MKHWINKNYKTLIIAAFLIPIITVAIVSISHVTKWYGISNPITWSVYLSIGIEIAALSALAAISANMGKKVYFPFAIVTLIQFIGNIFFAYSYIDINGESFKMWVELVSPLLEFMGVEPTDYVGHKRFLSLFAGGMLPIISLSFLHMLVKFTEEDRLMEIKQEEETKDEIEEKKEETSEVSASEIIGEVSRLRLSEDDLKILEQSLLSPPEPNENLKRAMKEYSETLKESDYEDEDLDKEIEQIISVNNITEQPKSISSEQVENTEEFNTPTYPTQEERKEILVDMMNQAQELGLYDEPLVEKEIVPALSDEEVREMFMKEYENPGYIFEENKEEEQNENIETSIVDSQITDAVTAVNDQITDSVTQINIEEVKEDIIESEDTDIEKKSRNVRVPNANIRGFGSTGNFRGGNDNPNFRISRI